MGSSGELIELACSHALKDAYRYLLRDQHLERREGERRRRGGQRAARDGGGGRRDERAGERAMSQRPGAGCKRAPHARTPRGELGPAGCREDARVVFGEDAVCTYRVAEIGVQSVRELIDARGDIVEVDRLLATVALDDIHDERRLQTQTHTGEEEDGVRIE